MLISAILLNITIVKTVALLSFLAWVHNLCIDEGERHCEMSHEEEALLMDIENMMNTPGGYVSLVMKDNHNVEIPITITDNRCWSSILLLSLSFQTRSTTRYYCK